MINVDDIKAEAVEDFVGLIIRAFESGFVDSNTLTLAQLHEIARNHIRDSYGIETPDIVQSWGEDVAKLCDLANA